MGKSQREKIFKLVWFTLDWN